MISEAVASNTFGSDEKRQTAAKAWSIKSSRSDNLWMFKLCYSNIVAYCCFSKQSQNIWEYLLFHSLLFLEAYRERRIRTLKWAHNMMSPKQTSVTKYPILLLQIRDKQVWSLKGIYIELVFTGNHSFIFKQSWYSSRSKAKVMYLFYIALLEALLLPVTW